MFLQLFVICFEDHALPWCPPTRVELNVKRLTTLPTLKTHNINNNTNPEPLSPTSSSWGWHNKQTLHTYTVGHRKKPHKEQRKRGSEVANKNNNNWREVILSQANPYVSPPSSEFTNSWRRRKTGGKNKKKLHPLENNPHRDHVLRTAAPSLHAMPRGVATRASEKHVRTTKNGMQMQQLAYSE